MLRAELNEALKTAMKSRDSARVSSLRLILAALKERDIAARSKEGHAAATVGDEGIWQMLQSMVRQRRESIELYRQGKREDLVAKEEAEIAVIEEFLPRQLDAAEAEKQIRTVIGEIGAAGIKDMGKVMAALKQRYAGKMDFGLASGIVKRLLG
jgi:uncharacterized protein YqeY